MIFINSPFAILDEAFRSLYPDKKYKACIEPSIKDDEGNRVFGFTQFSKGETPVIAISAELRKAKMCSCGLSISGSGTIRDYSRR